MARNHAVADVVLVGGDEDLRRALEEAQDYGVRIHLWGVEAAAPEYNQSQSLIAEADRRWIIPGDWVTRFVRLREDAVPVAPVGVLAGLENIPAPGPAGTLIPRPHVGKIPAKTPPTATPADLARLAAAYGRDSTAQPRPASPGRGWEARFAEHDDLPRLRDLSTARQAWEDNEQDAIETTSNPVDVGERFGRRWAKRATREQRDRLLDLQPSAPRYLDGELLRYAESLGIETWEDQAAKFAVREGFWDSIASAEPD